MAGFHVGRESAPSRDRLKCAWYEGLCIVAARIPGIRSVRAVKCESKEQPAKRQLRMINTNTYHSGFGCVVCMN
jgi:hypothetical protein